MEERKQIPHGREISRERTYKLKGGLAQSEKSLEADIELLHGPPSLKKEEPTQTPQKDETISSP